MSYLAASDPDFVTVTISLLGGLAIFLYGMGQMTDSLKTVAGGGLARVLRRLTTNRFTGATTGALVTAVVQSSSVTTVLVVGFITAGLMTLQQSIGVIMGANVGTTITAQIVAFNVYVIVPWLLTAGFGMYFVSKREKVRLVGLIIMGLGFVFFGMQLMGEATRPLRDYQPFIDMMQGIERPLLAVLASALFTAVVQSSSATTGLVIMLATQGFISLEAGIALALGANIGTCVSAFLAALGKPVEAIRAALVHAMFNVAGVLIWLPLTGWLAGFVRESSDDLPRQIANAHTAFNVANTAIFIWFTGPIARIVERLVPSKPDVVPERARATFLEEIYLQTPAMAVDRVRLEAAHLGDLVLQAMELVALPERRHAEVEACIRDANLLHAAILRYAARLGLARLGRRDADRLSRHIAAANDMQAMGETILVNLGALDREREAGRLQASEKTRAMLASLLHTVQAATREAVEAVREGDIAQAERVIGMKERVNEEAAAITRRLGERLTSDDPSRLLLYRVETRVVEVIKRLYYFSKRIAKTVARHGHEAQVDEELPTGELAPGA